MARGNPKLSDEIRRFVVQQLACFDTPTEVAEAVKERFGMELSRQAVAHYDPEHSPDVAPKWREIYYATREKFIREEASAGIANQSFRLRALHKIYLDAMKVKNRPLALQALEQAAKEKGGLYTNKREFTGQIDWSALSDEQVLRMLRGEEPSKVLEAVN